MEFRKLVFVAFFVLNLMTTQVLAECTCEKEGNDQGKKTEALKYKLIGLASIFSSGAIGVSVPFIGNIVPALNPNRDSFFVIKSLAAGVILATGFVHILPDAQESLTSPCLKEHLWADFPFTGLVAMVAAILTLLFEAFSAAHQVSLQPAEVPTDDNNPEEVIISHIEDIENPPAHSNQVTAHTHATHGHTHTSAGLSQVNRYRIISRVLELGIIVHSVIIGLSLGASGNPKSIKGLIIALSFHQFFEGMGLGGCIFQAQFTSLTVTMMGAFFSLTTPIGLAIGIAVTNAYKENSSTTLIVEGILNAASAGILIYMALVDLLSPTFMNPRMQNNKMLYLCSSVSLLLGAGLMSLLAIWA
uniref:zinc transporter 5-like n=1 Tax=Erigeron canadensis TaxID=72917 RepID=UPI001CB94783|nr:zinc transporter 5-like [Erigeron canadensis]